MTRDMDTTTPDMTTSISDRSQKMDKISRVTAFNTDEWSTWKSGFLNVRNLQVK